MRRYAAQLAKSIATAADTVYRSSVRAYMGEHPVYSGLQITHFGILGVEGGNNIGGILVWFDGCDVPKASRYGRIVILCSAMVAFVFFFLWDQDSTFQSCVGFEALCIQFVI